MFTDLKKVLIYIVNILVLRENLFDVHLRLMEEDFFVFTTKSIASGEST